MQMQKIRHDRTLGANLRRLRIQKCLTQEEIVIKLQTKGCEVSRNYYSRYEIGELNIPVAVIVALKDILGCTLDEIFKECQ